MSRMNRIVTLVLILVSLTSLCLGTIQQSKAISASIIVPDDYPTITDAIGNATDGDSIFIRKGTYDEKTLETNKTLSLIGEGAELTKINLHPLSHQETIEDWGMNGYYVENVTFWDNSIIIYADDTTISSITIFSPGDASIVGDRTQITRSNITIFEMYIRGSCSNIVENMLGTTLIVNGSYSRIEENSVNALHISGSYLIISKNTVLGHIGVRGEYCKVYANNAIGITDSYGVTTYGSGNIWIGGSYCEISSNNVKGIDIEASSCFVHDNNVAEDKNDGRGSIAGNGNIVANNLFDHLAYGIQLGGSNNIIYANRITRNGEGLVESGASNIIYANYVANNGWGVDTGYNGLTAILYCNNFVDNRFQVSTIFPVNKIDYFDNGTTGNYWSNYNGTDMDGDGLGDIPFVIDSTRSDRYPLISLFDIGSITVSVPEWVNNMPTPQPLPMLPSFPESTPTPAPSIETPTPTPTSSLNPSPSIPEFPTWIILPLAIISLLAVSAFFRKRSRHLPLT